MRISSLLVVFSLLIASSSSAQSRRSPIVDLTEEQEAMQALPEALGQWERARTDEARREAKEKVMQVIGDPPILPMKLIDFATLEHESGMKAEFDRTVDRIMRAAREGRLDATKVREYVDEQREYFQHEIERELPREMPPDAVAPKGYPQGLRAVADRLANDQPAVAMELYLFCGWLLGDTIDAWQPDLESILAALRIMPESARAYAALGAWFDKREGINVPVFAKSALPRAIAAYREAVRLDPKDAHAHDALSRLLLRMAIQMKR